MPSEAQNRLVPPQEWNVTNSVHGPDLYFGEGGAQIVLDMAYFRQMAEELEAEGFDASRTRQLNKINCIELIRRYESHPKEAHYDLVQVEADRYNERFEALQSVFGSKIPDQYSMRKLIYFSGEQIDYIWRGRQKPESLTRGLFSQTAWTLITRQDMLRPLTSADLAFRVPYAEWNGSNPEFYSEVCARWLQFPDEPPTVEEMRQFHAVQPSAELEELMLDCEVNKQRLEGTRNFVNLCCEFAILTGEITDNSGKGNVYIGEDGELWAPDILYPVDVKVLHKLQKAVLKVQDQKFLTAYDYSYLMNGLGFVRSMNYLSALYDLPKRIRLFDNCDVKPATWQKIHTMLVRHMTFKKMTDNTVLYEQFSNE